MHFATLTTLLIPLLLSSVLATPTPIRHENALVIRQCGLLGICPEDPDPDCGPSGDEPSCPSPPNPCDDGTSSTEDCNLYIEEENTENAHEQGEAADNPAEATGH